MIRSIAPSTVGLVAARPRSSHGSESTHRRKGARVGVSAGKRVVLDGPFVLLSVLVHACGGHSSERGPGGCPSQPPYLDPGCSDEGAQCKITGVWCDFTYLCA